MYEYITAELPQVLLQFPELNLEKVAKACSSEMMCKETSFTLTSRGDMLTTLSFE